MIIIGHVYLVTTESLDDA